MDVLERAAPVADLSDPLPIPARGLEEVLRSWSGRGQLWQALAACGDQVAERRWDSADVRARAHRILFAQLEPFLAHWPADPRRWIDAIPPRMTRSRIDAGRPLSGTDWRATRRLGWPPQRFVSRPPRRHDDDLLTQALAWTMRTLDPVYRDAAPPVAEEERLARARCEVGLGLLAAPALADLEGARPGHADLRGIRGVGPPWSDLAAVASRLLTLDADLERLAWEVVAPDPELSWRLFHLAVLGEVLHGLRTSGARVLSLAPLGGSSGGPAFSVIDSEGEEWDLWFEAAGAWGYYGQREPYRQLAAGVRGAGSALGCDIMLIQPGRRALLVECKYSANGSVVARDGYLQALAYATEANEMCPAVTAAVVGPATVVTAPGWASTLSGLIGMLSPEQIPELIEHCLRGE